MSAVMKEATRAAEPTAKYLAQFEPPLLHSFELLAGAPEGVKKLRQLILSLAVRGKLVSQDPSDEPARDLLSRIAGELGERNIKKKIALPTEIAANPLPSNWANAALGQLFEVLDHRRIPVNKAERETRKGPYPYYGANGQVGWIDAFLFKGPHVLVAEDGGFFDDPIRGVAYVADGKFWVNNHAHVLRPVGGTSARYWTYCFNSMEWADLVRGDTRSKLNQAVMLTMQLPVPPLAEQHRIVERVEELMNLCDALEEKGRLEAEQHAQLMSALFDSLVESKSPQELAENWARVAEHFDLLLDRPEAADALEQTVLELAVEGKLALSAETAADAPPWPRRNIGDIAEVQGGIQKTPLRRPMKAHYPYLRVANVQRNALVLDRLERFELAPDELEKWRLRVGDLLIVEGNGSEDEIGRCAVWRGEIDPCVCQNHLIRVRCSEQLSTDFLQIVLNSPYGITEMRRLAITTSGLYNLSVGKIKAFSIPVPPLAEQHRIVARVEELRALCTALRERLCAARKTQSRLADALVETATA